MNVDLTSAKGNQTGSIQHVIAWYLEQGPSWTDLSFGDIEIRLDNLDTIDKIQERHALDTDSDATVADVVAFVQGLILDEADADADAPKESIEYLAACKHAAESDGAEQADVDHYAEMLAGW